MKQEIRAINLGQQLYLSFYSVPIEDRRMPHVTLDVIERIDDTVWCFHTIHMTHDKISNL